MSEGVGKNSLEGAVIEGQDLNRENFKKTEVVRVVVARSRSARELRVWLKDNPNFDLKDLKLSSQLWAEKNAVSANPWELMPVGGGVKDQETLEQTARRELFEETHLQPIGGFKDLGQIDYLLDSKKAEINSHFVGTRILPTDSAFPLHPDEDKIAYFHYLDLNQMTELLTEDYIHRGTGGRAAQMLGSLRDSLTDKEVIISTEQKESTRLAIAEYAESQEAIKKIDVLKYLARLTKKDFSDSDLGNRIELLLVGVKVDDFDAVQKCWEQSLRLCHEYLLGSKIQTTENKDSAKISLQTKILEAIDLSNFAEEIELTTEQGGYGSRIEATLRLVYGLLETSEYRDEYLEVAATNPYLKETVAKIKKFFSLLAADDSGISANLSKLTEKIRQASSSEGVSANMNEGDIEAMFCRAFGISNGDLNDRLVDIDEVLHWVETQALDPKRTGGTYHRDSIKQINEITGANLTQLLEFAVPSGSKNPVDNARWKSRLPEGPKKNKLAKRLVFEARRKLALLFLLSDAGTYYQNEKLRQVGNYIETAVFSKITTFPGYDCELEREMDESGNLLNVQTHLVSDGEGKVAGLEEDSETGTVLRRIKTGVGDYFIASEKPTAYKSKESFLAKMIIRGLDNPAKIKDVARRALLIVAPDASQAKSDWLKRVDESLPSNVKMRSGDRQANDCRPVLEVIKAIAAIPGVEITDYAPTPILGQRLKSQAAGGGGEIRLAKFYIRYTAVNGEKYSEEVQIFLPDFKGRSAFFHKEKKEEDDRRYFLERLFLTRGHNSFVDLLHNSDIYGSPMRSTHRKKKADKDAGTLEMFNGKK
ncbi:MAG: hypothetical protein A2538_00085 [Candidatus Magasanikbacteria bacterium RIFOXYD2_FULL_41_14]|uniref:Nudix hydrolase domain-containing protein n=1 Tax=Candidatus Magasanikbacteria bacterium RIFOXYD2_FULL_41_14 TaxID=1798709 RepID=A0A1F6PEF6_9BACT|nr:MAG: hypothetical protein A2538_00085 [Candidatus Magasanikbacteria bacterium RIFOXYD2_FULL_41_14]